MSVWEQENLLRLAKKSQALMENSMETQNLFDIYKERNNGLPQWIKALQVGKDLVLRQLATEIFRYWRFMLRKNWKFCENSIFAE